MQRLQEALGRAFSIAGAGVPPEAEGRPWGGFAGLSAREAVGWFRTYTVPKGDFGAYFGGRNVT